MAMTLALLAPWLAAMALWLKMLCSLMVLTHALWGLPRHILLSSPHAFRGLRRSVEGWQLWSEAGGWQPVQLRPDSIAQPFVVVLRFRLPGGRLDQGLCIPRDAMSREQHRRLRLRLKFSRRRWAEPQVLGSE